MQKTQIIYRKRPSAEGLTELKELMPYLDITLTRFVIEDIKTVTDPIYKIQTLDWTWFRSLFAKDNDVSALALKPNDLKGIGITEHWGFYSLDDDTKHQFYLTDLGDKLDPRAIANGFKTNFAWMFCHEKLHGVVWGETRNRQIAAALVHEWEKQGVLKEKVKADVELYHSREKAIESLKNKLDSMQYQTLQIFRPLISKNLTQKFGENKACIDAKGRIFGTKSTCPHGQSFYESIGMKGHNGHDIAAIIGENVYHAATFSGWVSNEIDSEGGIGVDVVSNEPLFFPTPIPTELINSAVPCTQDGVAGFTHYVKMRYWHLKTGIGANKKQVTCGTIVGLAGSTGASSGPHLHFAPKWCLPDGRGVGTDNGYAGAFDPAPYYNHEVLVADHAKFMNTSVVPLSTVEQKDVLAQLSVAKLMLLALQKLVHTI
jgi:hypothetical protein